MKSRPTSVTVVCWLLVSTGILGAILEVGIMSCHDPHFAVSVSHSAVPVQIQCGFSLLGSIITTICGLAMLEGKNWARLLYLIWSGLSLLALLIASPDKLNVIPSAILFGLIALFLFQPKTVEYFQKKD
jgi:hypothetical protein